MKSKTKIYSVIASISALSLLSAVFPALPQRAEASQPAVQLFHQEVTVATSVDAPEMAVTQSVTCLGGVNSEPRLDYLLNSGCAEVAIAEIPNLPSLAVTTAKTVNRIFVQNLPAPPQLRWLHTGQPQVAFETSAFTSAYKPAINSSSVRYFAQLQNLVGQSRETKTLSELQVQRC